MKANLKKFKVIFVEQKKKDGTTFTKMLTILKKKDGTDLWCAIKSRRKGRLDYVTCFCC